jgi:hypothetical protein
MATRSVKNFSMSEPEGRVLKFSEDGQRSREEFSLGRPSLGYFSWAARKVTGVWGNAPYLKYVF